MPERGLEERFSEVLRAWDACGEAEVARWESSLSSLNEEQARLVKSGEWIIGRPDLLGIMGRSRRELDHCAVIAWLLDPRGAHGLRTQFLGELLRKAFPEAPDFPPMTSQ